MHGWVFFYITFSERNKIRSVSLLIHDKQVEIKIESVNFSYRCKTQHTE